MQKPKNEPLVIQINVTDVFNGQSYKVHITETMWDNLTVQIETARAEKRKALTPKANLN